MYSNMFYTVNVNIMKERKDRAVNGGSWWIQFGKKELQGKIHFTSPSLRITHPGLVWLFLSDSGTIWLLGCGFAHGSSQALQAFCYACLFPNPRGAAGY